MKKCYYFPTWEEQKDVSMSLDNEFIIFAEFVDPIDALSLGNGLECVFLKKNKFEEVKNVLNI